MPYNNVIRKQAQKRERLRAVVYALMVVTYLNKYKERKNQMKEDGWFDHGLLKEREQNLHLVHHEFRQDPDQFKTFLRMDEYAFSKLLHFVEKEITTEDTLMRKAISARDKLTITLRFLATGKTYRSLIYSCRVSESAISLFIPKVCKAIYNALKAEYLKVPNTPADWKSIAEDFFTIWNFPNTIGALDGKHLVFRGPASCGSLYYNFKNQNSIVLLALIDAKYNFIYIDVGTNGRVSDGGVFQESAAGKYTTAGQK